MVPIALLVALVLTLTATAGAPSPPSRFLQGELLVAKDSIKDPRFSHAVIYMVHHDSSGAMGLVVNRPVGEARLSTLLDRLGRGGVEGSATIRIHYGGPVEAGQGLALHTTDWMGRQSRVVFGGVALTADPEVLEAVARGPGPRRVLFALGYAGWAPGQLEAEIDRGDWISVTADEALIFDDAASTKWERAMARRKITL